MAMFRRGKRGASEPEESAGAEEQAQPSPAPGDAGSGTGSDRSGGPWDVEEIERADPDLPRIDLGSLQIPGLPGVTLQVEADQQTGQILQILAAMPEGGVRLQAFAAPRSTGLWEEIRDEIRADLATGASSLDETDGPFGPELRAILPVTTPEGRQAVQAVRFCGIDGPRWFLQAVFLGKAAVEPEPDDELHTLVRQTIVVRGPDAMAPRTALPLRLPPPEDAPGVDEEDLDDQDDDDRYADLDPFERGPEITEIR